jgi:polar amino acid transport system substrate-binding protein
LKSKTLVLAAVVAASLLAASVAGAQPAQRAAGTLHFCSDITYPPEEFFENGKPVGSDIDIGTDLARRLGKKAEFTNTGFDGIIASLLGKKCDAIISGMNNTPERSKQVTFVNYLSIGQSFMAKKGNPLHVKKLSDVAGKSVAVEVGTTNKDFLDAESKALKKAGKPQIDVVTFPKDTDAAAALATGKVDLYFGDSPVVAYYVGKNPGFGFAGAPVNPIPVGIATRKEDAAFRASIQKGVKAMYADGTMKRILAKWKMSAFALKQKQ